MTVLRKKSPFINQITKHDTENRHNHKRTVLLGFFISNIDNIPSTICSELSHLWDLNIFIISIIISIYQSVLTFSKYQFCSIKNSYWFQFLIFSKKNIKQDQKKTTNKHAKKIKIKMLSKNNKIKFNYYLPSIPCSSQIILL